jgi:hypothetical protein
MRKHQRLQLNFETEGPGQASGPLRLRCFYTSGVYMRIGVTRHCHVLSCVHDDLRRRDRSGHWCSRR